MTDRYDLALAGLRVRWSPPEEGRARVTLDGDLDNLSLPVLDQALERLWADGTTSIQIDLAEVGFIDSGGLGALVGAWRRARELGGAVTALNPTSSVRDLMQLTGIARYLLPD